MADPYRLDKPFKTPSQTDKSFLSLFFKGMFRIGITLLLVRILAEPLLQRLEH